MEYVWCLKDDNVCGPEARDNPVYTCKLGAGVVGRCISSVGL